MTVARIAYGEMTELERTGAHEVLKQHPHYMSYLTKNKPDGVRVDEWVFLRAATWPDAVRSHDGWKPDQIQASDPVWYHRPGDHFANFPVFAKDAAPAFMAKVRERPAPHDIVCALKQRVAELQLRTASPADKAVALCWLLHLVGDIHQPLHCATLYKEGPNEDTDFSDGDAGGNAIALKVGDKKEKVRLHSFWDELLAVTSDLEAEIRDTKGYAEEAYRLVTVAVTRVKEAHPRATLSELKKDREFKDWANESFELAQKVAYWDGKIAEIAVRAPRYPMPIPDTAPEEPPGYSAKARQVADQRGAVAGYRLVDTLRHAMK
jgi:hypothetical protein